MRPKTVVAVGAIGPSLHLENLVAAAENRVRVDRWGRSIDPGRNATHVFAGDVVTLLGGVEGRAGDDWAALWAAAERECRERVDLVLAESGAMSGAAVASSLNHIAWADLVVASSLPIRDVDAHLRRGGRVFANRGASGIDGFVSTALGVASQRARTLAVTGDLSLLHDANGFINDGTFDLTIVLIDNHGGGLFDSLPQARHAPGYERLFVTPPNRDFATFADFHGLRYGEADDPTLLEMLADQALDRPGIDLIRVEVDRAHDGGVRAQLDG
jgi:2-succinyl-5-enolpyruvyl-6-hydroxy-3-cyclohexene-1-carboxylate synthase